MNYEEAFRHYREGTATEEEKAFVQEEIAKAKALSSLMDDQGLAVKPAPIKEADAKEVKDAKQHLVWKRVLAGLLAVIVLLVALGAILGGVFGSAAAYARKGKRCLRPCANMCILGSTFPKHTRRWNSNARNLETTQVCSARRHTPSSGFELFTS